MRDPEHEGCGDCRADGRALAGRLPLPVYGPQAALIAERFGTRSRYSGASLGYQLGAPFAGGLAPIIAPPLLHNGMTNLAALVLKGVTV